LLRITGGEFRGRLIHAPSGARTRPTQARLRQALFNSLQARIGGARVLDLFSGSGALALEALSWGAERAVLVESGRAALKAIERNVAALGVEPRVLVVTEPLPAALTVLREQGPFDIVLADPPYGEGWESKLLVDLPWNELLAPGGVLCLEWSPLKGRSDALPEKVGALSAIRDRTYGDSRLTTYELSGVEVDPNRS
jgi:16S rRNA (guanine966-N2)-methyltransferase